MYQEQLCQSLALADILNYQSVNNATVYSLGVDLSKFKRIQAIASLWTTTAGTGTASFFLNGSANSNFTGNTNLANGTNLSLTANNTTGRIEIRADQLTQINSTYRYIRLGITGATNAVTVSAYILGSAAAQAPAGPNYNLNSTFMATDSICTA